MDTVPFHFDAYGGFGTVQGLARLDEQGLELQFSTSDSMFGVLKSGARSLRVPLDALLSVRYSAGWFWLMPVIELRVRDILALKGLPESDQGRVSLSLKFRDRHDGRAFAADLELMRSRRRIVQLDRAIEQLAAQAPTAAAIPTAETAPMATPPPAPLARGYGSRPESER
ncbi:MAG: hypothetical protein ACT4NL_03495 [Pseudomarimonas sp.]